MELSKLLNQYREKTLSVLIIIISLIIASNIYKNQTNRLNALTRTKDEESRKNTAIEKILDTQKVFDSYRIALKKKDINKSINTITSIARDSGITINSIKPGKEENEQVYTRYPFELAVSADSYHNIARFISRLESHSDIYFVDGLNIKVADGTSATRRFTADIILSTVEIREAK